MTRLALVLAAGAIACAPVLAQQPEAAATGVTPQPTLEVENLKLDLGTVPEGGEVQGTFVLKNSGTADLKIFKVKPG